MASSMQRPAHSACHLLQQTLVALRQLFDPDAMDCCSLVLQPHVSMPRRLRHCGRIRTSMLIYAGRVAKNMSSGSIGVFRSTRYAVFLRKYVLRKHVLDV